MPLLVVLALVMLAAAALLPLVSAVPQAFPDIILELVASFGYTNKSGELALFWGCLAGAALLAAGAGAALARGRASKAKGLGNSANPALPCAVAGRAGTPGTPGGASPTGAEEPLALRGGRSLRRPARWLYENRWPVARALAFALLPNALLFVLMGRLSLPLLLLGALYLAALAAAPPLAERVTLLALCAYYALCGLVAACNWLGLLPAWGFGGAALLLGAGGLVLAAALALRLLVRVKNRTLVLNRIILALQCFAPLVLYIFIIDRYQSGGAVERLAYPAAWYVVVGLGMAGLLAWAVAGAKRRWHVANAPWQRLVLTPTLIAIFVFNSYILPAQFFQTDTHHHGEQMLPWQQIVTEGQTAYEDYFPASGLFPMVIGFFQNVLLGGAATAYPAALGFVSALAAGITICLCRKFAGPAVALGLAFMFSVPVYDRQYLVLPALMLLGLPGLIRRRRLWLPAWVLCCLAAGLYYPVYGAALLAGTLPFGAVQLAAFFKTGEAARQLRRVQTWLLWGGCLVPVALCLPLLLRMARHTLLFSGGSVLADGISLFGAPVNDEFLPWLAGAPGLRLGLFYGFKFAVPVLGVLLFVYCTALYLARRGGGSLWHRLCHPAFYAFSCGAGVLAVSYSFTTVRADYFTVFSRTGPILTAVAGIFFLLALARYGRLILAKGARLALAGLVLGLTVYLYNNSYMMNFPAPEGTAHQNGGFATTLADSDSQKLVFAHALPEGFVRIDEAAQSEFPRLGPGYIAAAQLDELKALKTRLGEHIDAGFYIANIPAGQLYYYPLGAKAAYSGTWNIFKDSAVQADVIRWLETHPSTLGYEITPFTRYALYHYLSAQRECAILDDELWVFPETAAGMGWEARLAASEYPFYPGYVMQMDLGNYAGSRFDEVDAAARPSGGVLAAPEGDGYVLEGPGARLEFELAAPLPGMVADYLYLELDASIDLAQDAGQGRLMSYLTPSRKGDDYRVTVYWAGEEGSEYADFAPERSFVCNYVDGRLLLALGSNPAWLYEDNLRLAVEFGQGFAAGDRVAVKELRFLRYRHP